MVESNSSRKFIVMQWAGGHNLPALLKQDKKMKIELKESLSFIAKPELLTFDLDYINGAWVIKAKKFKQIIKKREADTILNTLTPEEVKEEIVKTLEPEIKRRGRPVRM